MSNADDEYRIIPPQDPMKNNWEFTEVWIDPSQLFVFLLNPKITDVENSV